MEKQALEEVVIRMRDQLKEKDRILQDMTAEKVQCVPGECFTKTKIDFRLDLTMAGRSCH